MNIFIFYLKSVHNSLLTVGNVPFVLLKRPIIDSNLKMKFRIYLVNNIVKPFQKSRHEKG
jgi:hypothetical protein